MNPVYYVFLVIIVLSFVTGLIITYIDNKNGVPIDKEVPKKQAASVSKTVQDVAVRSNNLNDTLKNMPPVSPYTANVVPYLPVENEAPSFMVEQSPFASQQQMNQGFEQMPVMNQTPAMDVQTPVYNNYPAYNNYQVQNYQTPVVYEQQVPVQPVVTPVQPDFQSMIQQPSQHQIQIDNIGNSDIQNYYSVPVLVPMSMDDDSL